MNFNGITSERQFWNWLKDKLPGHVIRIENSVGHGIPDVNICSKGKEAWIELKVGHSAIDLRPGQYAWGMRRARQGGTVFVINYCPVCDTILVLRYPFYVEKHGDYVSPVEGQGETFPRHAFSTIELG